MRVAAHYPYLSRLLNNSQGLELQINILVEKMHKRTAVLKPFSKITALMCLPSQNLQQSQSDMSMLELEML